MIPCPHSSRYLEPLVICRSKPEEPIRTQFGTVPCCVSCRRVVGEYKMDYSEDPLVRAAVKAFTPLSFTMMMDHRKEPPFSWVWSGKYLIPLDYRGELKAHPEIGDEPPF